MVNQRRPCQHLGFLWPAAYHLKSVMQKRGKKDPGTYLHDIWIMSTNFEGLVYSAYEPIGGPDDMLRAFQYNRITSKN